MPIPFDSLCLAAVVAELQEWVGARVQQASQPDEHSVVLCLYLRGERHFLMSTHPQFARAHFIGRKPKNVDEPGTLLAELKRRIVDGRLVRATQRGFDRVLELEVSTAEGPFVLVAELMGKHSNLMLLDEGKRVVGAMQWVGPGKSKRLVLPNRKYEPPPFPKKRPIWEAGSEQHYSGFEGASPFLVRMLENGGVTLPQLKDVVESGGFKPVFVQGEGVYPISVPVLGLPEERLDSYSEGAVRWFSTCEQVAQLEHERKTLLGQLERVLLARDVALTELRQAADTAARAREFQEMGELILAYQHSIEPESSLLKVEGYDGKPIEIPVRSDESAVENAERYFRKAKRAKKGAEGVRASIENLESDRVSLRSVISLLENAATLKEVQELHEEADRRRWLHHQALPTRTKAERPYEGHAVRETHSPGGWKVLYGDNATSNDFLTMRVAKPNDWWLHVRGSPSAHVVIATGNQPDRVQREDLLFAAQLAVRNSPSKHSKYVPVDYTLKKYVRKPRGSAPGAALYEREKTLYVD